MEKYLISGEVYENKKLYAVFYTSEYFICDLSQVTAVTKPTELDLKIIKKLDDIDFKKKLLENNDNFWLSLKLDYENESVHISNIKCYKDPTLISYQYEQFKSLY